MKSRNKLFWALAVTALWPIKTVSAQETLLSTGHYDLGINYTQAGGWHSYIHDYSNGQQRDTSHTIYAIGSAAEAVVPADPAYTLLGEAGTTVWIAPEIYSEDIVYLGIGAPLLERNLFAGGLSNRGQLSMRLVSVSGSGPDSGGSMSMWQSGFPPRFYFSSADGIDETDSLDNITANFHAHYNWGFTKPGLYRITFEISGTLLPELGGNYTATQATYTFEVVNAGDDSPLRYAWPLGEGWEWSTWMGFVYTGFAPWYLDTYYGWLYLPPFAPDGFWGWSPVDGWLWSSQDFFPWMWSADENDWVTR